MLLNRFHLSNHLGSSNLELDYSAALISYEEYYPFGSTSYSSGRNAAETSLKRYRYVGKERDDETGLYYYGARYYASWLCRFVSVDPLKDNYPQLASYQYAGNDPIGDIDVDGLEGTKTEIRTGGIPVESDETKLQGIQNRVQLIEYTQKQQAKLDRNAENIISKLTGEGTDKISNKINSSTFEPLTGFIKGKTLDKAREEAIQGTEFLQKRELDNLNKKGIVTTNTGENFKVSRRDKLGNPRNIGFRRQGELVTSRGTETSSSTSRTFGKAARGLKLFKSIFDGVGPIAPSPIDLALVASGQVEPGSVLPLSFVAEDMFSESETILLNAAISEGFNKTFNIIENSPNFSKNFEFIFVNESDAFDILSNRVNSLDKLQGFNENNIFDSSGGNFAILISRSSKQIDVNSIFYSENGFKTN